MKRSRHLGSCGMTGGRRTSLMLWWLTSAPLATAAATATGMSSVSARCTVLSRSTCTKYTTWWIVKPGITTLASTCS